MKPGELLADRYEIRSLLGRGGMGEVYLARDHRLETDVAIKCVPAELALEQPVRDALVREARILVRLSHPNIVRLFDLADTPDGLFLVLEYVCGPSLHQVLKARPRLQLPEAMHVLREVGAGLAVAHAQGVIHRDLKPPNLLVSLEDVDRRMFLREKLIPADLRTARITVTDFGISKIVQKSRFSASLQFAGTPPYMAPEQFRGEVPSPETDIYALGVMAYELVSGSLPLGNLEPAYFHLFVTPPPLTDAPTQVSAAIQRALSKERKDRFPSVAAFLDALGEPSGTAAPPKPPSTPPPEVPPDPPPPESHRLRTGLVLGGASLAALAVLAGIAWKGWRAGPARAADPNLTLEDWSQQLRPELPMNAPPFITELPPVIGNAQIPDGWSERVPTGPREPRLVSAARAPVGEILGEAPDGTIYFLEYHGSIQGVRDGQIQWRFLASSGHGARGRLAPDGRVWIWTGSEPYTVYCFNAAGQGGRLLTASLARSAPPVLSSSDEPAGAARCDASAAQDGELPKARGRSPRTGQPWSVPLDHECEGQPEKGPDGTVYLRTRTRTVYALNPEGGILWTFRYECDLPHWTPLNGGTLVIACHTTPEVIAIQDGKLRWKLSTEGPAVGSPARDAADRVYFVTRGEGAQPPQVYGVDRDGRPVVRIAVPRFVPDWLRLTRQGELLVVGMGTGSGRGGNVMMRFADAARP